MKETIKTPAKMRKESQKFSKDETRLNDYLSINRKHTGKLTYDLTQTPVFINSDDEEYFFEVEDY